jgi:NAD(P)-dependent dehydrogenase (short-subunit alcohol dehydrogenase family)
MSNKEWNIRDCPSLEGKKVIVTGANTGLGFETAKALALKGAHVVLACRNLKKAEDARARIARHSPAVSIETIELDLGVLSSVHGFAERYRSKHASLDLLINNAGIMMPPYGKSKDGFEQQFGVNYLGHFLLTGLLLDRLAASPAARVVHLSSLAHKWGAIYFDDLQFEKNYNRQKAYGQSKLACLMFSYEMQRRLELTSLPIKSIAAHPGISDTELSRYLPGWMKLLSPVFSALIAQSAKAGAQPSLRAALDPALSGGGYIGPGGWGEYKGEPVPVKAHPKAHNKEVARKLWSLSESLVSHRFEIKD